MMQTDTPDMAAASTPVMPKQEIRLYDSLIHTYPQVPWCLNGDQYADLDWPEEGNVKKPSEQELDQIRQDLTDTRLRQQLSNQVVEQLQHMRKQLNQGISSEEQVFRGHKAAAAQKVLLGQASAEEQALLKAEADARQRQESPEQLAQKQVKKSTEHMKKLATLDGTQARLLKQIKEASKEELSQLEPQIEEAIKQIQ
jgi:hypothetical protein